MQQLQSMVASQNETNAALVARNDALQAEVQDLKSGTQAIEERARGEMGMVKDGEIYVQILAPNEAGPAVHTPVLSAKTKGN